MIVQIGAKPNTRHWIYRNLFCSSLNLAPKSSRFGRYQNSKLKNNIKDILNPYFTTKKNGTGLGLSIVNKIINDHNGKIDFIPIKNGAKINIIFLKQ